MCSDNVEIDNIKELSAGEDSLHNIINAYLERAIRVEKEFAELNREIAILLRGKEENTAKRALLVRIK